MPWYIAVLLGLAIVQVLVTIASRLQRQDPPTLVFLDPPRPEKDDGAPQAEGSPPRPGVLSREVYEAMRRVCEIVKARNDLYEEAKRLKASDDAMASELCRVEEDSIGMLADLDRAIAALRKAEKRASGAVAAAAPLREKVTPKEAP